MKTHLISYAQSELSRLDKVLPFFSPVIIYVPWGGTIPSITDDKTIIASFPPEELKPDADFNLLLDECFNWAYEQGETSRREIIKTGYTNPTSEESLRHIKALLGNRVSADTSKKDRAVKNHMLLHLANRLEEHRNDANRMLGNLNKMPSPLFKNADLTDNTQYPLKNLTGIGQELLISNTHTKQLLEAWHCLFNSKINDDELLLTLNPHIFEHLTEEWDIVCNNNNLENDRTISFKTPLPDKSNTKAMESLGKITIAKDIQKVLTSNINIKDKIADLKKLTTDFESMFSPEIMDKHINFSLHYFMPPEKTERIQRDDFLRFLSGKALLLAEI